MKLVKTIIKYIITIIIAIFMILFLVVNLASYTVLNKNYVLSKLEETNYYNKIYEEVKSNFENYIHQSGLEESVLENIISKAKVKKDTELIISNLYDGLEEKIDTQEIRDNLNKNIEETLGNSKLVVTQKNAINTLIDKICEEYTTTLSHYEYEKQINNLYMKIMKNMDVAKKAILVVIAISVILLLLLNIRRIYKLFSLLGVSLVASGVFFVIVNIFINMKIKVQTILILNDAISATLRNILTELLNSINSYGYITLGLGLVLIIVSNLVHNVLKYGNETYEEK